VKDIDDTAATAAYLNVPARTLEDWRYRGEGPPYVRLGRGVRYRRSDVDKHLAENTVVSR
jgi:excisionase family DNA binding protein